MHQAFPQQVKTKIRAVWIAQNQQLCTRGSIDHLCSSRASCLNSTSTLTAISSRSFSLSSFSRCSAIASASLTRRCSLRHLRARARAFFRLRIGPKEMVTWAGEDGVGTHTHTNVLIALGRREVVWLTSQRRDRRVGTIELVTRRDTVVRTPSPTTKSYAQVVSCATVQEK